MNIQLELAHLRKTIARIDARYSAPLPLPKPTVFGEECLEGSVVETARGRHFEMNRLFPLLQRHGSYQISSFHQIDPCLLDGISGGAIPRTDPRRWAFLDTETTGLAGGTGTCAFLIGLGSIEDSGFHVRQYFVRDFDEEASALEGLRRDLERFDVLVTFNGRTFDQPLLETRYTMNRARHPFARMEHLDLLHGARRLFRLRLENCRLVNLEHEILGFERHGDVPGEMIPHLYFEFLRSRRAARLKAVFEHNANDIVSLACLTGIVPQAFRDPCNAETLNNAARHGMDLLGLARWLAVSGRTEESLILTRRAIDLGLPDEHLFRALFDAGLMEKKLGREVESLATFTDLTLERNPWRVRAYEEVAKYYEHKERNFTMALECVHAARALADSPALQTREARLRSRTDRMAKQLRLLTARTGRRGRKAAQKLN
jgi:uncharacterized protein YprB with RNaseH-like and TPR domain